MLCCDHDLDNIEGRNSANLPNSRLQALGDSEWHKCRKNKQKNRFRNCKKALWYSSLSSSCSFHWKDGISERT